MIEPNDSIAVKDMVTAASPVIKVLVETMVKPKLESFIQKNKKRGSREFIPTEEQFTEYYHRTYKRLAVVNTLVFNNSQRFLQDIYTPLTLTSTNNEKIKEKVITYPKKLAHEYQNLLITDTAGMGKSTLMKKIFIEVIHQNLGIPLFIELRRLSKEKTILEEIQEQLNSLKKDFDSRLLLELLSEGGFIIILDGYDEISLNDRDVVTRDLQNFISKASNNDFFITSRPEKALSSFGNFQEFKINPLTNKEAFELLRKYDNNRGISALLIKKLQEQEMSNIEEFLTNPLLVSLLFTAFEHKQAIPFKKYLFYRQVYDANFENHDLTKGESYTHDKHTKLEIDDFHRVLRHLGFNCFKLQKIEFNKDELLKLIAQSRDFCVGLSFKESDFLEDILKTVPLFTQDGNYYRWAHKSLQEYFAAQFIYLDSKEKQDVILRKIAGDSNIEKFINVLDLYYDMDYKTFRNIIELDLLKRFEKHWIGYRNPSSVIPEKSLKLRKELLFLDSPFLFRADKTDKGKRLNAKKFSKMIEKLKKGGKRFNGVIIAAPESTNIFSIHYENNASYLLGLLLRKKSSLVCKVPLKKDFQKSKVKIDYSFDQEYVLIEITDDPDHPFNSLKNFDEINSYIVNTRMFPYTINSDEAFKALRDIRANIEKEKQEDFLINGI